MIIKRFVSTLKMMDIIDVDMTFDEILKLTGAQMEHIQHINLDRKQVILYVRVKKTPFLCMWRCKQSTGHSVFPVTIPTCRVFV